MNCERCDGDYDVAQVLGFHLCSVCRYDAKSPMTEFVRSGRTKKEALSRGGWWQKIEELVAKYGHVTPRILASVSGLNCYEARDVVCGLRRRGLLQYDNENKVYKPTGRKYPKRAVKGERWHQLLTLINKHGYITTQMWIDEYGISRAVAKTCLSKSRISGVLWSDSARRHYLTEAANGRVEETPTHKKAS